MTDKRGDIIEGNQETDYCHHEQTEWLRRRLEWFKDLRFGLFIHWGPYCQWDCCESWPLVPADTWARPDNLKCWIERGKDLGRFSRDYWNLNRTFNPLRFDPDAWADLAGRAGMRYITFTTKHHDGFCMFDTAATEYRITHPDCPFHNNRRANVTREVFNAFRRKGMGISCYFSKSDWHSPYYWSPDSPPIDRNPNYDTRKNPEQWGRFTAFVHQQIKELMTGYGHIDVLWLDGGQVRPPEQDIRMAELAALARFHQPGLIIADRTVGGPYENILTPEQKIPDEPLDAPWESCITLGNSWKFVPDDEYKSPREVIHMLIETAAKGGNLLLGVGPDPGGQIPPEAVRCLHEIGDWLRTNGEAIYGSRPVPPYQAGRVRFTRKEPYTYAFILKSGRDDASRQIYVEGICPHPGSDVKLLKSSVSVAWRPKDNGFIVDIPLGPIASEDVLVLRFLQIQTGQ